MDMHDRQRHSPYQPGCLLDNRDARGIADALIRVINSERGDTLDLGELAAVVNFVRQGPFAMVSSSGE